METIHLWVETSSVVEGWWVTKYLKHLKDNWLKKKMKMNLLVSRFLSGGKSSQLTLNPEKKVIIKG